MLRLAVPDAKFTDATFLANGDLLTAAFAGGKHVLHRWPAADRTTPTEVPSPRMLGWQLFVPHAEGYLRNRVTWVDGVPAEEPAYRVPWPAKLVAYHPAGTAAVVCQGVLAVSGDTAWFHLDEDGAEPAMLLRHGAAGPQAAFSPTARRVALSGGTGEVAVFDVPSRAGIRRLPHVGHVRALTFVTDDRLAVAAGKAVQLWDIPDNGPPRELARSQRWFWAVAVSPDGRSILAGGQDRLVRVFDAADGRVVARYDWGVGEVNAIAFAPDGLTVAAAGASGIAVWDVD